MYSWPKNLLDIAKSEFILPKHTDHGVNHWARVRGHGVRLAKIYGVNPYIPSLFSLFHDCRRHNEYYDPEHGLRSSELVEQLGSKGELDPWLSSRDVKWLVWACRDHSDGYIDAPKAVQVCWDADRLDLARVGITPSPSHLCTEAAKDQNYIQRAVNWSRGNTWR